MARQPFVVTGGELRRLLETRERFERRGSVGPLKVVETEVPGEAEVLVTVTLEPAAADVAVRGSVAAPWQAPCRRCGDPIEGDCRADVVEVFERHPTEGETWPLGEDRLDLAPMVRELVLLELPFAPEPPVEATGRCVACGRDVEALAPEAPSEPERDPRWAALDDLDLE